MAATTPSRATTSRRRTRAARTITDPNSGPGVRRVAIYTRRSTDEEHQPFSIDAQLAALHAYVASQLGWTVVAEYTDDASGGHDGAA